MSGGSTSKNLGSICLQVVETLDLTFALTLTDFLRPTLDCRHTLFSCNTHTTATTLALLLVLQADLTATEDTEIQPCTTMPGTDR